MATTVSATQPDSQVKLCVACLERDENKKDATETFKYVPMCKSCYDHWDNQFTYMTYQELAAGWQYALEKLQTLSVSMYETPDTTIIVTVEPVPKTVYCKSCFEMGKGPNEARYSVEGVSMCKGCYDYCKRYKKDL
jgi:hypothetical protein